MNPTLCLLSALGVISVLPSAASAAPAWTVATDASHLTFETSQSGRPIHGEFQKFTPTITFDKADLAGSHIKVDIDTSSAKTGDKTNDSSLPGKDWFQVATFPRATFESTAITDKGTAQDGGENYEAAGKLTILGVTRAVILPFTLKTENGATRATGSLAIKRLDYGMGALIDPNGTMVSNDVTVTFDLSASPTIPAVPATPNKE